MYFTYNGFDYKKSDACGKKPFKYIIYIKNYSTDDYKYKIITYKAQKKRRYIYNIVRYINYSSNYKAIARICFIKKKLSAKR